MHSFKIYKSIDKECENTWLKLEKNSNNNFFQSFNFINEIIKTKAISSLRIIILFFDNEPIAIIPTYKKNYLFFNIIEWIGRNYSDYSSPIISKNFYKYFNEYNFKKIWQEVLKEIGEFDLIFFNNQLSYESDLQNPLVFFLKLKKFSFIYRIKLPTNYSLYLNNLKNNNKKEYYEIHRINKKIINLEKEHNVVFTVDKITSNNFDVSEFLNIKARQLNFSKKKHPINNKFIQIYKNLINKKIYEFFKMSLSVNSEIIAVCFGFIYKNVFYYFVPVLISRKYDYFKPGKILILKIVNWLIENKIIYFDFGLGNERYKKNFSNLSIFLHRCIIYKGLKGFILNFILKIFLKFK